MTDCTNDKNIHSTGCLTEQTPDVLPVVEKKEENPNIVTLFFEIPDTTLTSFSPGAYQPGQFIMMWLPRVDEKPFVISYLDEKKFGVTILRRGSFTKQLCDLEVGEKIGFRGPYGRGFWGWKEYSENKGLVLLGGGCGMAPLSILADRLDGATILQGAPNEEKLLFIHRFEDQIIFTEDGTGPGRKGVPTSWLTEALQKNQVNMVYSCGPELMMKRVVDSCLEANVPAQVALERYMKCGFGVCGQCECDGKLVCRDGPVFSAEELKDMPSFGKYRRTATGRKTEIRNKESAGKTLK